MTDLDPLGQSPSPERKRKDLKQILSQPWIGPSISLVVLSVSALALAVAIATFKRQGDRWAAEDSFPIQLNVGFEPGLTSGGFRIAYASFFRGREPMRVQKLEIVSPSDATMALAKGHKAFSPLSSSIALDNLTGTSAEGAIRLELAIRTAQTPSEDQGTVVEIEATAVELTGEKRPFVRRAKAIIPPDAVKTPNL